MLQCSGDAKRSSWRVYFESNNGLQVVKRYQEDREDGEDDENSR